MSFDALAWAAKCRIPRSADKLVLLGLAEHCHRQTETAFPSIDALIEFSSLNRKTVIIALGRLEEAGLIEDSGERMGRTKQVKVYRIFVGRSPIMEQFQNRNHSKISSEESRKRDTEPVREPSPPVEAKASPDPSRGQPQLDLEVKPAAPSRAKRGSRLPDDWTPPPIDDLPLTVQAVVRQWPDGAYDFVAAGFCAHWIAEGGARASKRDWNAAWVKWLVGEGPRVMDMKRKGMSFRVESEASNAGDSDEARALIALQVKEDGPVQRLRQELRTQVGDRTYLGWLHPTFIKLEGDDLVVTAPSAFILDWIAQNFTAHIASVAHSILGRSVSVTIEVWR